MFSPKTLKIPQTVVSRKTEQDRSLSADYLTGFLCCFPFHLECFYIESWFRSVTEKSAEHKAFPRSILNSTAALREGSLPPVLAGPLQPQASCLPSSYQDLESCHPDLPLQSLEGAVHNSRRQNGCMALSEGSSAHNTNHWIQRVFGLSAFLRNSIKTPQMKCHCSFVSTKWIRHLCQLAIGVKPKNTKL